MNESALLVAIPEAEPIVGEHRKRFDPSAAKGVPAHVTLLYPFLAPESIGRHELATLGTVFISIAPFDVTFARTGRFGREVLWLDPDPSFAFSALTSALVERFPDHLPYAGEHNEVIPHLTIGHADDGWALDPVEHAVATRLPFVTRVREASLMTSDEGGWWSVRARFPLGGAR